MTSADLRAAALGVAYLTVLLAAAWCAGITVH
jgi:hypothetical protein